MDYKPFSGFCDTESGVQNFYTMEEKNLVIGHFSFVIYFVPSGLCVLVVKYAEEESATKGKARIRKHPQTLLDSHNLTT
ncbi:MAG TPA: hypothetical protein VI306_10450 [Pyrinomonadaceae bacterium]